MKEANSDGALEEPGFQHPAPVALAFLHSEDIRRLIRRAGEAAATPVSLHFLGEDREGSHLFGFGQCEVCRYLAGHARGREACRESRWDPSTQALHRGRPIPFLCHMGFPCVAVRALQGERFVICFGPYAPADVPQSLEEDAQRRLEALEQTTVDDITVWLSDIRPVDSGAVPAIAEWLAEALEARRALEAAPGPEPDSTESSAREPSHGAHHPRPTTPGDRYGATGIAAALAGRDERTARTRFEAVFAETDPSTKASFLARRALAAALVAATIEAAERAGMRAQEAWEAFPAFLEGIGRIRAREALLDAAMDVLRHLKRKRARAALTDQAFPELSRLVRAHLADGITLNELARELGQSPSAITHRLQRKFGVSFSDYVGWLRVERAKELFRKTQLSVAGVARRVGINDASNFAKLFRKHEGVSPRAYRARVGRTE